MRHHALREWFGPAVWSLLVHGIGVAVGVPLLGGGFSWNSVGRAPIPSHDPATLRIVAPLTVPEPAEVAPPFPAEPVPSVPEPAAAMEEPRPASPEAIAPVPAPEKPEPMPDEPRIAENAVPLLTEPRTETPEPKTPAKGIAKPKGEPMASPPSAPSVTARTSPGAAAPRASGAMRVCSPADYLRRGPIPYPDEARRSGWEGQVMLAVSIDAEGRPTSVGILRGSGHEVLDESARRAVAGWRFRPERVGTTAVPSRVLVPVRFAMR